MFDSSPLHEMLKPFWRYYGGKWRAAPRYPKPKHATIVEPFAGAAGYSCRYPDRDVILVEKYPVVAGIWRYLIQVTADEIQRIPSVDRVDDLPSWVPQEARWLVGFLMNDATIAPSRRISSGRLQMREKGGKTQGWTQAVKDRIAQQVDRIRHWKIIEGDYTQAPEIQATWFVDPPYNNKAGSYYVCNGLDYSALGAWCRKQTGQVMVCENAGADWLPFREFATFQPGINGKGSQEVLWCSEIQEKETRNEVIHMSESAKRHVVVLDIETIPDFKLWTPKPVEPDEPEGPPPDPTKCERCLEPCSEEENKKRKCTKMQKGKCKLPDPPKEKRRKEPKSEFPPLYAHQVVCISGLLIIDNKPAQLVSMSAETDTQEYHTLKAFGEAMDSLTQAPNELEIVTWYGRGFDARVLELRSLRHNLSQPWISYCEKASPYAEAGHIDLKAILGHRDGFSLSKCSEIIGLDAKGVSGADVLGMYQAGQHNLIAAYCRADVWRLGLAYYRYLNLRGRLVGEEYEQATGMLYGILDQEENREVKLYAGVG